MRASDIHAHVVWLYNHKTLAVMRLLFEPNVKTWMMYVCTYVTPACMVRPSTYGPYTVIEFDFTATDSFLRFAACCMIQARWRARVGRANFKKRKRAVLKMQRAVRFFRRRKAYKHMKEKKQANEDAIENGDLFNIQETNIEFEEAEAAYQRTCLEANELMGVSEDDLIL